MKLVTEALPFWLPYFPSFSEAIRGKIEAYNVGFAPGYFYIFGFYDDTVIESRRPGALVLCTTVRSEMIYYFFTINQRFFFFF